MLGGMGDVELARVSDLGKESIGKLFRVIDHTLVNLERDIRRIAELSQLDYRIT